MFPRLDPEQIVKIEISIEEKKNQKHRQIGFFSRTIDGGKIFKYSKKSHKIELVQLQDNNVFTLKKKKSTKGVLNHRATKMTRYENGVNPKIFVEKDCVYVEALNYKNAVKKLMKGKIIYAT